MPVDKETSKLLVINTHRGLFAYKHLVFGVSLAPALFQKRMEEILQGISRTSVYFDNVLVIGKTDAEHLQNLQKVLRRIKKSGLKLKKKKCEFFQTSLVYLGHEISVAGLQPFKEKHKHRSILKHLNTGTSLNSCPTSDTYPTMGSIYQICRHCWHPCMPCYTRIAAGGGQMRNIGPLAKAKKPL